jgi:segregation and condensation protein B
MDETAIKFFIEAALLAAGRPLTVDQLQDLFDGRMAPDKSEIRKAITDLIDEYEVRGITIGEVASGFRIQVKAAMADRLQKLWEERPPRYSRALFETLALIAYRQPITRGEIEEVRGVSVSSNIIRSLVEREWIRVVGHRDVPGKPAMFGTTRLFLDYFGLKKLDELPPLADLSDWESLRVQLNLPAVEEDEGTAMPPVPELPVLYPEIDDEDDKDDSSDLESAYDRDEADERIPELVPVTEKPPAASDTGAGVDLNPSPDTDDLLVSEWPDPVEATSIASIDSDTDDDTDKDASAGGG